VTARESFGLPYADPRNAHVNAKDRFPSWESAANGEAKADPPEWDIVDYFDRPPSFADAPNGYATLVAGTSMEPRYHPGEIIYVQPDKPVTAGAYVFVQLRTKNIGEPHQMLIRRLAKMTRTKIVLQQFNPARLFDIAMADVVCMHRIVGSGE